MKKNVKNGIALLLVAMAVLALDGCPQETETEPLSNDATLAAIALNGKTGQIPAAVPKSDFEAPLFDVNAMSFTHLYADSGTALADATVSATPAEAKASIQYSKDLITWNKTGKFAFVNEEFVYISVRSADGSVRNYYKAQVHDSGNIAAIMDVKINDKIAVSPPEPYPKSAASLADAISNAEWAATLVFGTDNAGIRVEGTPANSRSLVQIAKVAATDAANPNPTWSNPAWETTQWPRDPLEANKQVWAVNNFTFSDGDYAAFKCVSPDGSNTQYFAVKAVIPYVTSIQLAATNGTVGSQAASAAGAAATVFNLPTPSATGAVITVATVTGATVSYAKVAAEAAA
ncbi:MAG: hypothetical protein LBD18_05590, partial [Treponema sp.]|nr:hypothetical protein [Treponema sp.]